MTTTPAPTNRPAAPFPNIVVTYTHDKPNEYYQPDAFRAAYPGNERVLAMLLTGEIRGFGVDIHVRASLYTAEDCARDAAQDLLREAKRAAMHIRGGYPLIQGRVVLEGLLAAIHKATGGATDPVEQPATPAPGIPSPGPYTVGGLDDGTLVILCEGEPDAIAEIPYGGAYYEPRQRANASLFAASWNMRRALEVTQERLLHLPPPSTVAERDHRAELRDLIAGALATAGA